MAKVIDAEAITAEELFSFDQERGGDFSGPTTEEVLEWDEVTRMVVDEIHGSDWSDNLADGMMCIQRTRRFLSLVRIGPNMRSDDEKQQLQLMRERGELPWQQI